MHEEAESVHTSVWHMLQNACASVLVHQDSPRCLDPTLLRLGYEHQHSSLHLLAFLLFVSISIHQLYGRLNSSSAVNKQLSAFATADWSIAACTLA